MPFGFNEDKSKFDIDQIFTQIETVAGNLTALIEGKTDTGHKHDASDVESGVFAAARIPSLAVEKITGILPAAKGGTGKAYGYAWQLLATSTNDTAMTYNLSGYTEVMFAANCTWVTNGYQAYVGSAIIPVALLHATTLKEVYLTGGNNPSQANNGRGFAVRATTTRATPAVRAVDGTARQTTWYVYAR